MVHHFATQRQHSDACCSLIWSLSEGINDGFCFLVPPCLQAIIYARHSFIKKTFFLIKYSKHFKFQIKTEFEMVTQGGINKLKFSKDSDPILLLVIEFEQIKNDKISCKLLLSDSEESIQAVAAKLCWSSHLQQNLKP